MNVRRSMNVKTAMLKARAIDRTATTFVVRLWDGMDNEWVDVCGPVDALMAMALWEDRTAKGTKHVGYGDIDYYAIFPASVQMVHSEQGRKDLA